MSIRAVEETTPAPYMRDEMDVVSRVQAGRPEASSANPLCHAHSEEVPATTFAEPPPLDEIGLPPASGEFPLAASSLSEVQQNGDLVDWEKIQNT